MYLRKCSLRDATVYAVCNEDGSLLADGTKRVEIRYKPIASAKTYRASLANLQPTERNVVDLGPIPTAKDNKTIATSKTTAPSSVVTRELAAISQKLDIVIYTDGACTGNPGPAGIGAALYFKNSHKNLEISEYLGEGTNNIAELTAILRALQKIPPELRSQKIGVFTDSSYSIGVLSKGWKAKANQQLIATTKQLLEDFSQLQFVKVKGHAGIPENELCDELARLAITNAQ